MHRTILFVGAVAGIVPLASAQETSLDISQAYAAELLVDASSRISLLGSGQTVGHDGRFFLASDDGNFRLQIGGEIQFRYYGNIEADDDDGGFQLQRTRLDFRGHVIDPKLTYRILTNFDRSTGDLTLQDAYGEYEVSDGFKVRWGQFKLPFDREFFASSPTQTQTIERSLVSSIFRLDRSQGIQLSYEADRWRVFGAFSDGRRAANTAFTDPIEADFAVSGRAEVRLGEAGWRQFRDQTAFNGDKFGVLLGGGLHWQQEGSTGAPSSATGTVDLFQYAVDASIENDGWNLLGAVTGRVIDDANDSLHDFGLIAQGGVFVSEHAELFARYAHIFPDDSRSGGSDDFAAITAGMHWYFIPGSHAVKLSAEATYYPDAQADSASIIRAPDTGVGLLPDSDGGQIGFGLQMQIVF